METVLNLMGHLTSATGASLLAILAGASFMLFGIRLYRIFVVFAGMVVGGMLGQMVGEIIVHYHSGAAADVIRQYSVLPPVVGAILCGVGAMALSRMALGIVIGAGAFYAAFKIGMQYGLIEALVAAVVAYVVISFLAVMLHREIIILTSSFTGSALILAGVLNFLYLNRTEMFTRIVQGYTITILAAVAVFFVVGVIYQVELERQRGTAPAR